MYLLDLYSVMKTIIYLFLCICLYVQACDCCCYSVKHVTRVVSSILDNGSYQCVSFVEEVCINFLSFSL